MRKQKLVLLVIGFNIFCNICMGQSFVQNFPFKVGNVFVFKTTWSNSFPPGGGTDYYKGRILKDTLISSKKYYFLTYYAGWQNRWWRVDSASGMLLIYDSTRTCAENMKELLVDSLFCNYGDSTHGCHRTGDACNFVGKTPIFSLSRESKRFFLNSSIGPASSSSSSTYCRDFGFIASEYHYSRVNSYSSYTSLYGCLINGVLYGDTNTVEVKQISTEVSDNYSLSQNFPNPFNPSTKINYEIKSPGFVSLKVFDLLGKEVAQLVNEKQNAGSYAVDFNSAEFNLPSGIYFYTLNAGDFKETKKMVLVK